MTDRREIANQLSFRKGNELTMHGHMVASRNGVPIASFPAYLNNFWMPALCNRTNVLRERYPAEGSIAACIAIGVLALGG